MQPNAKKGFLPPPRILLVDDDEGLRQEFIEYFEDFTIAEASSGEEAVQILKKPNVIDLVILDLRMAGMNGIETLDRIKQIAPHLRVVILTGYGSKDAAVEALRSRADDYLEKPIDINATRAIIEKHLGDKERQDYGAGTMDKVRHVTDFLKRNFHKKVTLEDAANAVYLSPKYLSRIFKEQVRKGFNEYKLSLRIEQAKVFLKKTAFTIEQISDKLGYQNSESFIRQFKKITALTPTEFRRKPSSKAPRRRRRKITRRAAKVR